MYTDPSSRKEHMVWKVTHDMPPSKSRRARVQRDGEEQNADQTKQERGREQECAWQLRFLGREASHAGEIIVPP